MQMEELRRRNTERAAQLRDAEAAAEAARKEAARKEATRVRHSFSRTLSTCRKRAPHSMACMSPRPAAMLAQPLPIHLRVFARFL